jgi:hypothetical protein
MKALDFLQVEINKTRKEVGQANLDDSKESRTAQQLRGKSKGKKRKARKR